MIGLGGVGLDIFYRGFTFHTFLWILGRYKLHQQGFIPPPETSQVGEEFPHAPNPP